MFSVVDVLPMVVDALLIVMIFASEILVLIYCQISKAGPGSKNTTISRRHWMKGE